MKHFRTDRDFLGELPVPEDALYGIHALRARTNFPDETLFPAEWYRAIGLVKQACYMTYAAFKKACLEKYPAEKLPFTLMDDQVMEALQAAAAEVAAGRHIEHFIVPAISGGAGTSLNMNVNEIIANVALLKLGHKPGEYRYVDPVEQANVYQSTNDVIPTSLRVTVMFLLNELEPAINLLRQQMEKLEKDNRNELRIGFTEMQEAVPTSFGKMFSAYNEAFSRDWWRVSKCFERIKLANLGGSAVGTGLAVPRFFIMEAIGNLQRLTHLPITRSENLADATSNLDAFVEVHATLKSFAVNLEKMVSDLRLLSSDLRQPASELSIPPRQAGSSIMPGKVNPVIPEFVVSAAHRIYANDMLIASLSGQGMLELNAYLPVIGCALIESLKLLIACAKTVKENLLEGLQVNVTAGFERLMKSPAVTTALVPYIGYH
ncbi:MAG TPA: lyase family protein, partial [Bacteroidales bacterium]|nr:lyase family protein [Bacteroidales bacterium]